MIVFCSKFLLSVLIIENQLTFSWLSLQTKFSVLVFVACEVTEMNHHTHRPGCSGFLQWWRSWPWIVQWLSRSWCTWVQAERQSWSRGRTADRWSSGHDRPVHGLQTQKEVINYCLHTYSGFMGNSVIHIETEPLQPCSWKTHPAIYK